jgi:hypothetical protein
MQTFQDAVTLKVYAFNPDVSVTDTAGVYSFSTAAGAALNVPATLQPYTVPPVVPQAPDTRATAQIALTKSDTTMHRVSEAVMLGLTTWTTADVVVWADYRRALRAMVDGAPTTAALPTRPAYPAGT